MKTFWNKKIPTILGLLLLVIAVVATSYLVNTGVIYFGKAAPTENPEDVRITNITDTSLTITYKTEAKVIGTASIGEDKNNLHISLDERDQLSGIPKEYFLHSISVKNLNANANYVFSLTSGATTYQNGQDFFNAKTGTEINASPSAQSPLTGKLVEPDSSAPSEAIIFVTTNGAQTISTLVKSNGVYVLPLNSLRTPNDISYASLNSKTVLQVLATDGKNNSQIQVTAGTNPVPDITLGNNYNFLSSQTPIASTAASLGFPPFPQSNLSASPIIVVPQKDQTFNDSQPRFSGTTLPNQQVTIEIHSDDKITATVTSDANGNWTYRPAVSLSPGQHTISITSKDSAGILQTIQQSFTVFASGTNLPGNTSPTPTPNNVTPQVTTVPTISPTVPLIPTIIVSPTIIPTSIISQRPTLPPTGSNALITSTILGIATTVIGIVLFIFTKGAI